MTQTKEIALRVLIGKEGSFFVARSVDYALSVQSETQDALPEEFICAFAATYEAYECAGLDMLKDHPKAHENLRAIYESQTFPAMFTDKHPDRHNFRPDARVMVAAA